MNRRVLGYSLLGVATLALVGTMLPWAIINQNKTSSETKIIEVPLAHNGSPRGEYIVGEEFDPSGLFLCIDNKEIAFSDCRLDYDFSSAGRKAITAVFEDGDLHYEGKYCVDVLSVRHIDVRDKTLTLKKDGSFDTSRLLVYAELSSAPKELPKPVEFNEPQQTVAILNEKQYSFLSSPSSEEGFYNIEIKSGFASSSFGYVDPNVDTPYVDSVDRILHLENASGDKSQLTLYCQTSTRDFSPYDGSAPNEVTGTYVYKKENGEKQEFHFLYKIEGWTSSFLSSTFNEGLADYQGYLEDGDAYRVEVDGKVFFSRGSSWHKAVLAM